MLAKGGSSSAPMEDLPSIDFGRIQDLLSTHEENLYQVGAVAKGLMLKSQPPLALLIAVAALETVHGAFLAKVLGDSLPGEESSKKRELIGTLRGIWESTHYSRSRLACLRARAAREAEPKKDIKRCMKGIKLRNDIMHRLSPKGKFKMRGHSQDDYTEGYLGALALAQSLLCRPGNEARGTSISIL